MDSPQLLSLLLLSSLLISPLSEACSRRHRHRETIPGPPPIIPDARDACRCVTLQECPALLSVLRGPRPLPTDTVLALQRATCEPVLEPDNPRVRCCPQHVLKVTETSWRRATPSTRAPGEATPRPSPPDPSQCGVCGQALDTRIVGGVEATVGQFPWIARLGYTKDNGSSDAGSSTFNCGGSLVSAWHVVTAAHCVLRAASLSQLRWVRLGEHDERSAVDCDEEGDCAPPPLDFRVAAVRTHPNYKAKGFEHDIAVLRLASPVSFTSWVHPICLPAGPVGNITNARVVVAGWGTTEPGIPSGSPVLQALWLRIVDQAECEQRYRNNAAIQSGQLCAGGIAGEDSCKGDSGGPLARPIPSTEPGIDGEPRYTLLGVVSFGARVCGTRGLPGVYTNTAFYLPWLRQTMSDMDKQVIRRSVWRSRRGYRG